MGRHAKLVKYRGGALGFRGYRTLYSGFQSCAECRVSNRPASVTPKFPSEVVPAPMVMSLFRTMQQAGVAQGALLIEAGVPVDPLRAASPAGCITPRQYSRLCTVVSRQLADETFGAMPDAVTPPGTLRMLALGMLGGGALGTAMQRAIEFNASCRARGRLPQENRLWVQDSGRHATLAYLGTGVPARHQHRVLAGLAIWLRFCGWMIGQEIDVVSASCAGPAPERDDALRHFFPGPVRFNASSNTVTFSARHLEAPIVRDERQLAEFMALAPYLLLYAPEACHDSVARRIRLLIDNAPDAALPSFTALTVHLNMSARTLRRRLESEGTSYQRIKDTARRDRAIRLLRQSHLSIFDVAEALGFSDPSAFHRSFKKWTGRPPGEFRC